MKTTIRFDRLNGHLIEADLPILPRIGDKITINGGTWYHEVTAVIHHLGHHDPIDDHIEVIVG